MVHNVGEPKTQEVVAQLQDCPLDGKSFLLNGGIIFLGRGQLPVDIMDRMLLTFLNLGQDGSNSSVGGIRLQQEGAAEVRGMQDRLRGESCLHIPEGLLRFGCPAHLLWLPLPGQVCQGGGWGGEVRDETAIVPRQPQEGPYQEIGVGFGEDRTSSTFFS